MDLEALALVVDECVRVPAAERRDGRLYAVRSEPDDDPTPDDDPAGAGACPTPGDEPAAVRRDTGSPDGGERVVLDLLAEGEARTLPQKVRPPAGVRAIALVTGVWAAPLEDDGPTPSRHPDRRRAHLTVLVGAGDGRDGVDVSVLRYGDGSPTVLRGGVGLVHQRMLRCWSRRPDAPWATNASGFAA